MASKTAIINLTKAEDWDQWIREMKGTILAEFWPLAHPEQPAFQLSTLISRRGLYISKTLRIKNIHWDPESHQLYKREDGEKRFIRRLDGNTGLHKTLKSGNWRCNFVAKSDGTPKPGKPSKSGNTLTWGQTYETINGGMRGMCNGKDPKTSIPSPA
ncbi:hypothetical protein MMC07_003165 [Pseudocyphellaria aurata]|nr:hypothetical protein [Pseudocyphellaria aurata]